MRIALIASAFALLAGSPAFAQCVYVACNGGQPTYQAPVYQTPAYQAPVYQAPPSLPRPPQSSGYDDGYAAGLAARSTSHHHHGAAVKRRSTTRVTGVRTTSHRAVATRTGATRAKQVTRHLTVARAQARPAIVRHVASVSRPANVRRSTSSRTHVRNTATSTRSHNNMYYSDQIKDRASTYRAQTYGQSTTLASNMSQSSSYSSSSSSTTWLGPNSVTSQNGQICGWGTRVVTAGHGQAQRQAVWVCQCPQGWRPPGY
jgi:hypothetical protein